MTPEERALYSTTLYLIGDEVEIAGTGIYGEVTEIHISAGSEDRYTVFYIDNAGNPQEREWKASALDPVDDDSPESNVVDYPGRHAASAKERTRAIAEARHATKH
jgi:hypothetical protein